MSMTMIGILGIVILIAVLFFPGDAGGLCHGNCRFCRFLVCRLL